MNVLKHFPFYFPVLALTACGTMPMVIDQSHPASVAAAEARVRALPERLVVDEPTRHTRDLLAKRAAQSDAAAASAPTPGSAVIATPPRSNAPAHEHHP
jgi:hypothetical protein